LAQQATSHALPELTFVIAYFLLVEDDPDQITLLVRALEEIGSTVEMSICHDGVEALDALELAITRGPGHLPRFVMLDANMPRVDGFQMLRKIRSNPATRNLPVVMFSSSTFVDDVERAYNLGVSAYFTKPLSFSDFLHIILAMLIRWGGHVMQADHQLERAILDRYFKGPHDAFAA
jgi:CheY-like chemotaxis protein